MSGLTGIDIFLGVFIAAAAVISLLWVFLVVRPGRGPLAPDGFLTRFIDRVSGADPGDLLRSKLTEGLEVLTTEDELRRGDEVAARVQISRADGFEGVDVGLLCTELYDHDEASTNYEGKTEVARTTSSATAHETWQSVDGRPGTKDVRFVIPPDGPFSYSGDCLSFRWEVVARGRRRRRLDALAKRQLSVRP